MLLACVLVYVGTELQNSGSWCSSLELGEASGQRLISLVLCLS